MRGRKKLKMPEMAGGSTPETKANDISLFADHDSRNGRYVRNCDPSQSERNQYLGNRRDAYRIQIGQDGDDEQGDSVDEADKTKPEEPNCLLACQFSSCRVHIVPNLSQQINGRPHH
jgi:hypothetical protein